MQKIESAQFEGLFESRLRQYKPDLEMVTKEQEEQNTLAAKLQDANSEFVASRRGDASSKEREQALQKLESAYFKYKEIISNIEVGRKFYNDLAKIVARFRDECKDFAYQRRKEAEKSERYGLHSRLHLLPVLSTVHSNIIAGISSLNISNENPFRQERQQEIQPQQNVQIPLAKSLHSPEPVRSGNTPHQSPGMWTPGRGIKFGSPTPANAGDTPAQPEPGSTKIRTEATQWDPKRGIQFG